MVTANYLLLPVGKGNYKTALLFIDTFTHFIWGFKMTSLRTVKFTVDSF